MGWTIGRQTSKQYGIPRGLPYLTGFVIHCEITTRWPPAAKANGTIADVG
jgi:hypothetical protein